MKIMDSEKKALIQDAVKKLTAYKKRGYIAQISFDYFQGNARKTEKEMGWGRVGIKTGLKEKETGIQCLDNNRGAGRKRTEDK